MRSRGGYRVNKMDTAANSQSQKWKIKLETWKEVVLGRVNGYRKHHGWWMGDELSIVNSCLESLGRIMGLKRLTMLFLQVGQKGTNEWRWAMILDFGGDREWKGQRVQYQKGGSGRQRGGSTRYYSTNLNADPYNQATHTKPTMLACYLLAQI